MGLHDLCALVEKEERAVRPAPILLGHLGQCDRVRRLKGRARDRLGSRGEGGGGRRRERKPGAALLDASGGLDEADELSGGVEAADDEEHLDRGVVQRQQVERLVV
eukprot:794802-Pleurochrysis_carterae.AAC.2